MTDYATFDLTGAQDDWTAQRKAKPHMHVLSFANWVSFDVILCHPGDVLESLVELYGSTSIPTRKAVFPERLEVGDGAVNECGAAQSDVQPALAGALADDDSASQFHRLDMLRCHFQ